MAEDEQNLGHGLEVPSGSLSVPTERGSERLWSRVKGVLGAPFYFMLIPATIAGMAVVSDEIGKRGGNMRDSILGSAFVIISMLCISKLADRVFLR